jgi:hypothetical protein
MPKLAAGTQTRSRDSRCRRHCLVEEDVELEAFLTDRLDVVRVRAGQGANSSEYIEMSSLKGTPMDTATTWRVARRDLHPTGAAPGGLGPSS